MCGRKGREVYLLNLTSLIYLYTAIHVMSLSPRIFCWTLPSLCIRSDAKMCKLEALHNP